MPGPGSSAVLYFLIFLTPTHRQMYYHHPRLTVERGLRLRGVQRLVRCEAGLCPACLPSPDATPPAVSRCAGCSRPALAQHPQPPGLALVSGPCFSPGPHRCLGPPQDPSLRCTCSHLLALRASDPLSAMLPTAHTWNLDFQKPHSGSHCCTVQLVLSEETRLKTQPHTCVLPPSHHRDTVPPSLLPGSSDSVTCVPSFPP